MLVGLGGRLVVERHAVGEEAAGLGAQQREGAGQARHATGERALEERIDLEVGGSHDLAARRVVDERVLGLDAEHAIAPARVGCVGLGHASPRRVS